MIVKLNVEYEIGEIVYIKTCQEQKEYMVIAYQVRQNNIDYIISCGFDEVAVCDFQIMREKNVLKSLN